MIADNLDDEVVINEQIDDALQLGLTALHKSEEAFESAVRLMDTYSVLHNVQNNSVLSTEAYIQPIVDLSLAGTGIELSEYTSESFLEVVKRIAEAILKAIRAAFKYLSESLANFDITSTWLITNISLLQRRLKTSRGRHPSERTVIIGGTHRFLRVGNIFADNASKLHTELGNYLKTLTVIVNDLPSEVARGGKDLIQKTTGKTNQELEQAIVESCIGIGFDKIASRLHMSDAPKARFGRELVKQTSPLLGGKSIFYINGDLPSKGIAGLRLHGFRLDNTYSTVYPDNGERAFNSLSYNDLSGIPEKLRGIVDIISKSSSRNVRDAFKNTNNDLERLITNFKNNKDTSEADINNLRRVANAYLTWSRSTVPPFYGNALQVVRAVLSYAQASVKIYK